MRLMPVLVLLAACGGSEPFTAVSFNAGLAEGFVLGASERAEVTASSATGLEADVICVQEVWLPAHVAAFEAAAEANYPNTLFMDAAPDAGSGAACAEDDLDPLFDCYEENCASGCIDEVADCLLQNCAAPFITLSTPCIGCLEANVGNPDTARSICETEDTQFAYGGSFGIGILSAHPFVSTEELVLDSTTNRRGVLHAVVDGPNGEIDVFCTHLTADLTPLPYTGDADGWIPEQLAQIGTLTTWVADQSGDRPGLLIGDFNTGPDGANYSAEIPENYDALTGDLGWDSPYVDAGEPCTYCPVANPLINSTTNDRVIDHIFVNNTEEATLVSARVLDQEIDAPACGETIQAPPSDHYGVQVTLEP